MQNRLLEIIETSNKKSDVPDFRIGDTIDVHQKLLDGQKERTQVFSGTVIARSGTGVREMVTVRHLVQGEGVERIFPIHSPRIAKIEIKKAGMVRMRNCTTSGSASGRRRRSRTTSSAKALSTRH